MYGSIRLKDFVIILSLLHSWTKNGNGQCVKWVEVKQKAYLNEDNKTYCYQPTVNFIQDNIALIMKLNKFRIYNIVQLYENIFFSKE